MYLMNSTEMERKNKRPRQEQEEEEMDIGNNGVVFKIFTD